MSGVLESYRWLEGLIEPTVEPEAIYAGKSALENLQAYTAQALDLTLQEAALSQMANPPPESDERLSKIREQLAGITTNVDRLRMAISTNLNHGGIVVFRWARTIDAKAGATLGEYANVKGQSRDQETGFAILNGIRIKSLQPDFVWSDYYRQILQRTGYKFARRVGVITYLMQARDVVYVRDLEALRAFSLEADIGKLVKDIYGQKVTPDTFKRLKLVLSLYRATVAQLATFGTMTGIQWQEHQGSNTGEGHQESPTDELGQSWSTVYAVLTDPKGLSFARPTLPPLEMSWMGLSPSKQIMGVRRQTLLELESRTTQTIDTILEMNQVNRPQEQVSRQLDSLRLLVEGDARLKERTPGWRDVFGLLERTATDWGLDFTEARNAFETIAEAARGTAPNPAAAADDLPALLPALRSLEKKLRELRPWAGL